MKNGLTKQQTRLVHGIAILMMLYHHLFCIPERLNTQYISVLNFNNINIELKLAWFCKICVAIYAFTSGYGLCITANNGETEYSLSIKDKILKDFNIVLRKLFSFCKLYWFVFFIFVPIGFVFFDRTFYIKEFLKNFFGISSSYNGEWWYVFQYIQMLFIFPFMDVFFCKYKAKKINFLKIAMVLLGIIYLLLALRFEMFKTFLVIVLKKVGINYIMVFLVGYLFAKTDLYKKIYAYTSKNNISEKILSIVILLLVILIRTIFADNAAYSKIDFILVPFFIYAVITILNSCKIQRLLNFFGKYSTYIWLTHTFLCYYYFQKLVVCVKFSTLIYLWLIILSLLVSWCLDKLFNKLASWKQVPTKGLDPCVNLPSTSAK